MKILTREEALARVDALNHEDPEVIRKRKEARRNITPEQREALFRQATERAMQEHYEKFKRESFEYAQKQREEKERKAKETEKKKLVNQER